MKADSLGARSATAPRGWQRIVGSELLDDLLSGGGIYLLATQQLDGLGDGLVGIASDLPQAQVE